MPPVPPDYTQQLNALVHAMGEKNLISNLSAGLIGAMFGASLAFVFSLLGDPIRRSVAKRRMRNELYRDLAYSRLSLNRAVAHWNQELTVKERNDSFFNSVGSYTETFTDLMLDSLKEIHLAVYDNYYQNHLEMFVSLREHREIREIYAKLR